MILRVHSVSDLITNSSTTTFTIAGPSSIDTLKSLINALISAVGGTGQADDYFLFSLEYASWQAEEWREEKLRECDDEYARLYENVEVPRGKPGGADRARYQAALAEKNAYFKQVNENPPEWWNDYEPDGEEVWEREPEDRLIEVRALNKDSQEAARLLSNLHKLFNIEARYNG